MAMFSQSILDWYRHRGRKHLPWQQDRTPYRVWISEIMLQQTQVNTVIPYFRRFIRRFPDLETLGSTPLDEVLHLWSGLGYYARARNLQAAAREIMARHKGQFPRDFTDLIALPGIGRSTAGAILALACDQRWPILDGNVKRVLTRFHAIEGWPGHSSVMHELWDLAERYTPQDHVAEYTQAMMDLGATVCTKGNPFCGACPLAARCQARRFGRQQELPARRPKKKLPTRETIFAILCNGEGAILLQQRPPSGVWGGLWSFPECPVDNEVRAWCEVEFGCRVTSLESWEPIRHTFSHFHLTITPIFVNVETKTDNVMEPDQTLWYNYADPPAVGLAAPVKTLLKTLGTRTLII